MTSLRGPKARSRQEDKEMNPGQVTTSSIYCMIESDDSDTLLATSMKEIHFFVRYKLTKEA